MPSGANSFSGVSRIKLAVAVIASLYFLSVYAGDSVALQLPLLGGQDSMHDWNYLLDSLGLLRSTGKVAGAIRLLGTIVIGLAAAGSIKFARPPSGNQVRRVPVGY